MANYLNGYISLNFANIKMLFFYLIQKWRTNFFYLEFLPFDGLIKVLFSYIFKWIPPFYWSFNLCHPILHPFLMKFWCWKCRYGGNISGNRSFVFIFMNHPVCYIYIITIYIYIYSFNSCK